jgi:hypothetical protein
VDIGLAIVEMLAKRAKEMQTRGGAPMAPGRPVRVPSAGQAARQQAPQFAVPPLDAPGPAPVEAHPRPPHLARDFTSPADLLAAFVFAEALAPPIGLRQPGLLGPRG